MNEFEKDEIVGEETEEAVKNDGAEAELTEEENADAENELVKELEGIRDMMQQELDRASQEMEDEYIIQELDEIDESFDEDEEEVTDPCECCGEKNRATEYGDDYPYCEDCRNLMKKYPLRASGIVMTLVMFAVLVASLWFSYPYMNDAVTVADASANYKSGYMMDALQSYYSYFGGGRSGEAISNRALKECIDAYVRTGYHTDAASLIQTYYNETALSMPWNKEYAAVIDEAENLTETYYKVAEITEAALSGKKFDYDAVMAELDALLVSEEEETTAQTENTDTTAEAEQPVKYNAVFVEYYKYIVMSVHEEPLEAQFEQLKKIDAIGEGYEWAYLSNYCGVAARLGDEEAVNYSFDKLVEINAQDMNAYTSKANYYRYLDTPDADKMLEIAEKAEEVAYSADTVYKHTKAIAYLLKGEGALALEEIKALFDAGTYTVQNCNLYAAIGIYTGDKAIYKEMKELLESYGYEISELVTEYKKGKITLEEVLKDQGGDI